MVGGIVFSIYYVYLCTRKSAYCAGPTANNTLKKSNLTFRQEVVSNVSFQVDCNRGKAEEALEKKQNIFKQHYYFKF